LLATLHNALIPVESRRAAAVIRNADLHGKVKRPRSSVRSRAAQRRLEEARREPEAKLAPAERGTGGRSDIEVGRRRRRRTGSGAAQLVSGTARARRAAAGQEVDGRTAAWSAMEVAEANSVR